MGRVSGGVVVLVQKELTDLVQCLNTPFDHMLCLKLSKRLLGLDNDALCTFVYIPPYQSPYYTNKEWNCHIEKVEEFLLQALEGQGDIPLILMGDFNSRISDWSLEDMDQCELFVDLSKFGDRRSKDKVTNQFGKYFIEFCNTFSLVPLNGNADGDENGNFTFVCEHGNSVVDYALLSSDLHEHLQVCFNVITDRVESNHAPIHLSLPVTIASGLKGRNQTSNMEAISFSKITWDSSKADEYLTVLNNENCTCAIEKAITTLNSCIETALSVFKDTILNAASCMTRLVRLRSDGFTSNRWYDKECAYKKRLARKASVKYHKTDNPFDRVEYTKLRNDYSKTIKDKNKQYKKEAKESLLKEGKNSFKFWSLSKTLRRLFKPTPDIDMNEWECHFKSVFAPTLEPKQLDLPNVREHVFISDMDDPITEDEVRNVIKNLKPGKAYGVDNICVEFLKYADVIVIPFLCKLYNKLFDTCYFPIEWSKSIIVPLFKKGDARCPDNYRGISLLSILSKVFTAILNKRLYNWAENNDKISPEQAGFRRSFSTVDHIFTLVSIVQAKFNSPQGGKVYACFIDYKKAFDSVKREEVWKKFQKLKVSTKMLLMLQAIYANVISCVRWKGKLSEFFSCPIGLKQGCLLSPTIFSLLIGDVADYVRNYGIRGFQLVPGGHEIFSLLFADDIVLLSSTPHGLQKQINNLHKASSELGLTINFDKTKVMVFRKGGFLGRRENWSLNGIKLQVVNSYKYLGYTLTTQLSETIACDEFISKAKAKVLDIMKTMWCIGSMNTNIFFRFFDAQVQPMLLYASEIWGLSKFANVEAAHLFALKRLLSVSDKTPNTMIYGETGRYPLYINSSLSSVKYWFKLLKMPDSRYPKQCLIHMTSMLDRRDRFYTPFWVQHIRDCLIKYGFEQVWIDKGTVNEAAFLRKLKASMIEKFIEEWNEKLANSERFVIYRSFKYIFRFEHFLNNITIKRFRDAFIRFRLGINDLGINKRFSINSEQQKMCPFCPNMLEDETHVLFVCPKYCTLRSKYLDSLFIQRNYSLNYIFSIESENDQRKVGMYLHYCMKHRDELKSS